jgi:hypothetical protein
MLAVRGAHAVDAFGNCQRYQWGAPRIHSELDRDRFSHHRTNTIGTGEPPEVSQTSG